MGEVEAALATNLDNVYTVFFAWDRSEITPVSQSILENAAADFAEGEATAIVVSGHTDTSGSAGYNEAYPSVGRARLRLH